MKILLIGDSITRGDLGDSFVDLLAEKFPQHRFINQGLDGYPMATLLRRLINHLKIKDDYDCIIIQGGYNDILLPWFDQRQILFRLAAKHQRKKGFSPLTAPEMKSLLTDSLHQIKQLFHGRLVLLTLGCLNENLQQPLNRQRSQWNDILREIAVAENILLADCGKAFDHFLQSETQTDYCLDCFWNTTIGDRLVCKLPNGSTFLSQKRQLLLTIDGVHLNKAGAEIFCDCVTNALGWTTNTA
ncbi:SGNH/GDSL hydrolase family protein [Flavobacterium sp.]|uniref:SGNH/GDSL hydrolase family protein n=1 Tax=Flavobacterium sp. TaxID=239 RepID=UPI0039E3B973